MFLTQGEIYLKKGRPRKGFNTYKIDGETVTIYLYDKNNNEFKTYIDLKHLDKIKNTGFHFYPLYHRVMDAHYAVATSFINKKIIRLHHLVLDIHDNKSQSLHIDHRNHNTLDNREDNLRITEAKFNVKNRSKININNSSGYRNVSHDGKGNPIVQLQDKNGKNHAWRHFKDVHEAGKFAEKMRKEWYGEFAGK